MIDVNEVQSHDEAKMYYGDVDDHYYNETNPSYFEIRSMIYNTNHHGWCLQESITQKKSKKNLFIAAICDRSPSQKWFFDYNGYLHNQMHPEKCMKRVGRWLKVDSCDKINSAPLKWIISTDGTIRWGNHALFAVAIPDKYTTSWSNRKFANLQVRKIINRSPKINEQWMIIHERQTPKEPKTYPPSSSPTVSPTYDYYPSPTMNDNGYNSPSIAPADIPVDAPSKDSDSDNDNVPKEDRFNISFLNMGKVNSYDTAFQKAKKKLERIIIGDVKDHPPMSNSNHDWFGSTWPENPVNMFIDDVLIGYEITDIDGLDGTLGFAGPLYIRKSMIGNVETVSTISGYV